MMKHKIMLVSENGQGPGEHTGPDKGNDGSGNQSWYENCFFLSENNRASIKGNKHETD